MPTATERKRAWRAKNPERSRQAERERAQARRDGCWGGMPGGSHESYWRYEASMKRFMQRTFWPRYGAGTTPMTDEEFRTAGDALTADAIKYDITIRAVLDDRTARANPKLTLTT